MLHAQCSVLVPFAPHALCRMPYAISISKSLKDKRQKLCTEPVEVDKDKSER